MSKDDRADYNAVFPTELGPAMPHPITLIPGDGIGPEVTDAVLFVLSQTTVQIEWHLKHAGVKVFEQEGTPLPDTVLDSVRQNGVALNWLYIPYWDTAVVLSVLWYLERFSTLQADKAL